MFEVLAIVVCVLSAQPSCMKLTANEDAPTFDTMDACHDHAEKLGDFIAHMSGAPKGTKFETHIACKPVGESGA